MSLLAPFFLLALPLIGIPIALHLWRKRHRETIPWGAMQFLVNDDHRQRRFSNIDRWLVLAARCLTLLFLIGAVAKPLLHSNRYGQVEHRTEDILVIDQSLSTSQIDKNGKHLFDSIREQAKSWVRSRRNGATVGILTTAGRPQWLDHATPVEPFVPRRVLEELDHLHPISARSDLAAAIRFASTTELDRPDERSRPSRRVWVLTDGQATDWGMNSAPNMSSGSSIESFCRELEQESGVQVRIGIATGGSALANLSVSPLKADGWRKAPGERLRVTTQIVNHGPVASPSATATWTIDGKERSQESVPWLSSGESKTIETHFIVRTPGTHVIACDIQVHDSLEDDNHSVAVVEALDRVPILLISNGTSNPRRLSDADFFTAALGQPLANRSETRRASTLQQRWRSVFDVQRATVDEIQHLAIDRFDAIVLMDTASLAVDQMERLNDYVHRGGGLWKFLGERTEIEDFNRDWYASGLGLIPVMLDSLNVVDEPTEDSLQRVPGREGDPIAGAPTDARLHPPERNHPTVQWLADSAQTDLDEVLIHRFYGVQSLDINSSTQALLRTSAGHPISLLSQTGKGRVILQTLPMNPRWTNWPLTGSFVVMVDSWLRHLTEPRHSLANITPGSPIRLRIPKTEIGQTAEIVSPDGERSMVLPIPRDDVAEIRFSGTFQSGIYELRWKQLGQAEPSTSPTRIRSSNQASTTTRHFAVNRPVEESQLDPLPSDFADRLNQLHNVAVTRPTRPGSEWLSNDKMGTDGSIVERNQIPKLPIWTPLLYALLTFLVVELALSGFASMRRFGRLGHASEEEQSIAAARDEKGRQRRGYRVADRTTEGVTS